VQSNSSQTSSLGKCQFYQGNQNIKLGIQVSNLVIVPRKNTNARRVCVDYTALNKHSPKDPFPLPRIDQIIDSTAGYARLFFSDAYSGYNQIKLKVEDEEKTTFITPYCYQVMPFGLNNAGATYQRMMQNFLGNQIGRNVQVYIDDVVITTREEATLIGDLREIFDNLDRYKLKLNPTKCSFGVPAGQLLGFLVLARGMGANPEKIQAILGAVWLRLFVAFGFWLISHKCT
jgi:hypothetical protein